MMKGPPPVGFRRTRLPPEDGDTPLLDPDPSDAADWSCVVVADV